MKKSKEFAYHRRVLLLASVFCAALLFIGALSPDSPKKLERSVSRTPGNQSASSDASKTITRKRVYGNEPVQVTNVGLKGAAVSFDTGIEGDEDWLNGLAIRVRNTSEKPVIYIEFSLSVRESDSSSNALVQSFSYGCDPKSSIAGCQLQLVKPGDEIVIGLSDDAYKALKRAAQERTQIAHIRKADLELFTVKFEDDTAWASGVLMRRDASNPRRWNRIEQQ